MPNKVPRWLARHPDLAHMVIGHGGRIRDWIIGSYQYVRYFFRRRKAIRELRKMRGFFTGQHLAMWYRDRKFEWKQDPWGGKLDFSSVPWVSVVLNRGDCDDMMRIAEYVLKPQYNEGWRAYIGSTDEKWHAVYILRKGSGFWLASNQQFTGPYKDKDTAARRFYGDKTDLIFYD